MLSWKTEDIKAIYDKLAQELALNKENMQLVLAGYIKDLITSDASIRASISKDERKRYVNSYSTTDAEGNTTIIPGYIETKPFNQKAPRFLISSPEKAAQIIVKSIKSKKEIVYINFLWRIIMFVIKLIPEKIYKKMKF